MSVGKKAVLITAILISLNNVAWSWSYQECDIFNVRDQFKQFYDSLEQQRKQVQERKQREIIVNVSFYTASDDTMNGKGITASGKRAIEGRTIAMDESIPFGTVVVIEGNEYVVQDRGGSISGNKVDIFVNDRRTAIKKGRYITTAVIKD